MLPNVLNMKHRNMKRNDRATDTGKANKAV